MKDIDAVTGDVVGLAIRLHQELGPGLLESVYEMVLAGKLAGMGYRVARQRPVDIVFDGLSFPAAFRIDLRPVDIVFDGLSFPAAFRIDLLVDERLLHEIKSVERLTAAHSKQLLTYLRLTGQPVGLLINFGGATLKEGLRRLVNDHKPSASPRLCAKKSLGE